jgi:hypothetical protein
LNVAGTGNALPALYSSYEQKAFPDRAAMPAAMPTGRHTARDSDKATYRRIEQDVRSGTLSGARKEIRKRRSAHLNPEQAEYDGYSESLDKLNFFLRFLPTKIRTVPGLA